MKFKIKFIGREVGAIGKMQSFTVTIEAANKDKAILKIYDTHEHLQIISAEEIK